ncbi:MAG TPA: hypothetical protein PKK43_06975 [Spirochaetota bacterium]|nr:hypothetical protein [Spirochaetota bacterium]
MKNMFNRLCIAMVISISAVLCACGGGSGSGGSSESDNESINEESLLLVGNWTLVAEQRTGAETLLIINDDGTFINRIGGNNYGGLWSSSDGISITLRYSVTNETPPTGTMMSGTVSDDKSTITGGYDYIPSFISLSRTDTWSATRR